ncbi:hypothetical protein J1C56_02320 [Aminobacter anthyllidis]|uniref:Uncharacterized protein n=1 Tax=Aminobacter anthyllidis TaxID=1035067 RepID=A0A9X1A6V0_9HYPH|nr:hypothetical protein [Aminobacter anthyllidis]MBT1154420.1 hypothetical protein [Aminobacter anthyllidis]
MAAPQQSAVPTYKETAGIPNRPNTAYYKYDDRETPGYALAKLLGALPGAAEKAEAIDEKAPSQEEQEQLAALAVMGAEKDRLRLAKGSSVFGLLRDSEGSMDAYEVNRGRRDADLFAGDLRTAYADSGLADSDDPKAFAKFVQQYQQQIFNEKLKGTDPSYYHGYVTRIGGVFEDMTKAHAGNLDSFITHKNKRAMENRIESKVAVELATGKEQDAFGTFMDSFTSAEGGGNYNAFHGNAANSNIRFTDMTIQEVLDWQSSGAWKRYGAKSSAVGKFQIIEGTLRDIVRAAGVDPNTKFTPAVQRKLIFFRLAKDRGMQDYLDGKISAEDFLDKGLAKEFAGLKMTNGKGAYDGDGLNKASHSARKTIAALMQFKDAYLRDPALVSKTDKAGKIVLNADDQADERGLVDDLDGSDAEFGVAQPEARKVAADTLIRQMEADPKLADREDLEDYMTRWRLPKADRDRVMEARDRLRTESSQKASLEERKATQEILGFADKVIRSGDADSLAEVRKRNPKVYQKLLDLQTTPADPGGLDNDGFLASANYGNPRFAEDTLTAYANGKIDQETYTTAMQQFDIRTNVKPILTMPGVKPYVDKLKLTIPGDENKSIFDAQLAIAVDDLTKANEGRRPALQDIHAAAQSVHQAITAITAGEQQSRMGRPEYQLGKQS